MRVYPPTVTPGGRCTYWFYMLRVDPDVLGASRDAFVQAVAAEGIAASPGYIPAPLYQWEIFRRRSVYPHSRCPYDCRHARKGITYKKGQCPEAERILETSVRLPVNEFFTATDVRETVRGVRKVAAHFLSRQGVKLTKPRR